MLDRPRSLASEPLAAAALLLGLLTVWPAAAADGPRDVVLVLDASGSMWGRMAGEEKIVVARRVLGELIADLPAASEMALVAYGHRREGDCADVETVVAMGPLDRGRMVAAVRGLEPKGKTPLTAATQAAIDLVRERGAPATVILVSDGLETCGGDPCATVRAAREAGVELVLHVVGFGIEEGDVAELECAAQAGGGLYFAADDAAALAAALGKAVAPPVEPAARLAVGAVDGAALIDAMVRVTSGGREVVAGRTYTGAETNPRTFGLPAGIYDVEVVPVRIAGAAPQRFAGLRLGDGDEVERIADFGSGELAVLVTRNGELSDAAVTVRRQGTRDAVTAGRSYRAATSNPKVFALSAGTYDVEIGGLEVAGKPTRVWESVTVTSGERTELAHDFASGELRVGATAGGSLVDATVAVVPAAGGPQVAGGRTYTDAKTNPKTLVLAPGVYRVEVKPVRLPGAQARVLTVTVTAGETVEEMVTFAPGG